MASSQKAHYHKPKQPTNSPRGAFGMGAVGGAAFHFTKGLYNSPRGERLLGGFHAVRMNAPRVGGGFAVWGGLFSTFDCAAVYLRQKEDPWNSILSGAATGGLLQMRQGLGATSRSALVGAALLAAIEGAGIMINKIISAQQNMPVLIDDVAGGVPGFQPPNRPPQSEPLPSSSSSWFGGWFGAKKEESRGFKTEVLESFDSPIPPTFEFK